MASILKNLGNLAQHWERLLFSTGGAINMQKKPLVPSIMDLEIRKTNPMH
jgi:hypothetical protein